MVIEALQDYLEENNIPTELYENNTSLSLWRSGILYWITILDTTLTIGAHKLDLTNPNFQQQLLNTIHHKLEN